MKENDYSDLTPEELRQKDVAIVHGLAEKTRTGSDLAAHLVLLTNRAFARGDRAAVEILERWALAAPTGDTHHRAWALYSMLQSGFLGTTLRVFIQCSESVPGRDALRQLMSKSVLFPHDMHMMSMDLSATAMKTCQELLSGQRPWVSEEDIKSQLHAVFQEYFARRRVEASGSWD